MGDVHLIAKEVDFYLDIGFTRQMIKTRLNWIADRMDEGLSCEKAIASAKDSREATDPYYVYEDKKGNILEL